MTASSSSSTTAPSRVQRCEKMSAAAVEPRRHCRRSSDRRLRQARNPLHVLVLAWNAGTRVGCVTSSTTILQEQGVFAARRWRGRTKDARADDKDHDVVVHLHQDDLRKKDTVDHAADRLFDEHLEEHAADVEDAFAHEFVRQPSSFLQVGEEEEEDISKSRTKTSERAGTKKPEVVPLQAEQQEAAQGGLKRGADEDKATRGSVAKAADGSSIANSVGDHQEKDAALLEFGMVKSGLPSQQYGSDVPGRGAPPRPVGVLSQLVNMKDDLEHKQDECNPKVTVYDPNQKKKIQVDLSRELEDDIEEDQYEANVTADLRAAWEKNCREKWMTREKELRIRDKRHEILQHDWQKANERAKSDPTESNKACFIAIAVVLVFVLWMCCCVCMIPKAQHLQSDMERERAKERLMDEIEEDLANDF
ncbi:unnamed protein product [Amoebophrya sp. A25]|nr:unnamed protein product [Amoebophrya sp. A25]|eukprot:GSA25T00007636001.1